jgi:hypothetical protein
MITDRRIVLFALCTAGAIVSGAVLVLAVLGQPFDARIASGLAGLFFVVTLGGCAVWMNRDMTVVVDRERVQNRERDVAAARQAAELRAREAPKVVVFEQRPMTQNGEPVVREVEVEHSTEWLAWRACYLAGLAWARRLAHHVDSTTMLKAGAFDHPKKWQAWADAMQSNGWLQKAPGQRSVLTQAIAKIEAEVRAGAFQHPTTPPPSFAPIPGPSVSLPALPSLPPSPPVDGEGLEAAEG